MLHVTFTKLMSTKPKENKYLELKKEFEERFGGDGVLIYDDPSSHPIEVAEDVWQFIEKALQDREKEIAKLAYEHESHVRTCVLCEANAKEMQRLEGLFDRGPDIIPDPRGDPLSLDYHGSEKKGSAE